MVARGRPVRRDALPENTQYADTGCDIHHSCLSCPLERCQYDEPGGRSGVERRARNEAIVRAARVNGFSSDELAAMFGLSRRTVFRVLHRRGEP